MQNMPISTDANDTVYIDVVGEIHRCSSEGHRYILILLDSATRFFIAMPMKKIDSVSVAEALMSQLSIFGVPKTVHMDHGSNLSSELMRQLYTMYGINVRVQRITQLATV